MQPTRIFTKTRRSLFFLEFQELRIGNFLFVDV